MSKNTVHSGQSFLNKVVECTGSVENAVTMAILNGINITDDIEVGTELIPSAVTNKTIANFFNNDNRPATALITIAEQNEFDNYGFPEGEFPISF